MTSFGFSKTFSCLVVRYEGSPITQLSLIPRAVVALRVYSTGTLESLKARWGRSQIPRTEPKLLDSCPSYGR